MYNLKYVLVGIIFATCLISVNCVKNVGSTDLLSITVPKSNHNIFHPGQQVIIQYTINGTPKNKQKEEIANYPNSLDMIFRWTDKKNKTIEFVALNGLNTDPYVDLIKNQAYNHKWKLPNCHFFRRYLPSEWSFSLIFQPQYSESVPPPNTKKHVVPLGPKQVDIIVPFSVQFNMTLMMDPHHKGC